MSEQKKPCGTCPFSSKCKPGELGGSSVETYVGQSVLPYQIPCHSHIDYDNPDWKRESMKVQQCVGNAIFRANIGTDWLMPEALLRAKPQDDDSVFKRIADFAAHHMEMSVSTIENNEYLNINDWTRACAKMVLNSPGNMEVKHADQS